MKSSFRNSYVFAAFIIILGAILFSTKAIVIKLAYHQYPIDSLSLLALRMLFSLPLFILASWQPKKRRRKTSISFKDYWNIALVGIIGFYGASYLDFVGLQYISASLERLILYCYPTLVLLISAIFFRKKITSIQLYALLITYVGIAIIFSGKISAVGNPNPLLGGIFIFFAALTYAIYLVGSGQLLPRIGTRLFTSYSMIAASVVVLAHNSFQNGINLFNFPERLYWLVGYMAVFATFIPTFLISEGIRIIGANNTAIIGAIGPVSTILLAYVFLGERLFFLQWVGTLIVIGGVLLISLNKNKANSKEAKVVIKKP